MYLDENVLFGQLLKELRKEQKVNMKKLSCGLCSPSLIGKFESGERYPDKLLRDRLMARMGVAGYDYENFINADEFEEWQFRQDIVWAIIDGNKANAFFLLDTLLHEKDMKNKLIRQFYFSMLFQIKKARWDIDAFIDISKELKKDMMLDDEKLIEKALYETVEEPTTATEDSLLCILEINLLLEYWNLTESHEEKIEKLEHLQVYLEGQRFDDISVSELFPKISYYIYLEMKAHTKMGLEECQYLLRLCNKSVQMLGDARRCFFLWEILIARKEIYSCMISILEKEGYSESSRVETLKKLSAENLRLLEAIEYSYELAKVEKQTTQEAYLYVEYDVSCIADVIRQRRQTLGMSMRELAEGICNLETLEDIEHKRTNPHMATVQALFAKLNLSTEFTHMDVVSEKPEAIDYVRQIKYLANSHQYDKAWSYLEMLKEVIPLNISLNKQFVLRCETMLLLEEGKISKYEHLRNLQKAIESTMPYRNILQKEKVYLTQEEILCIDNFIAQISNRRKVPFLNFMERYCKQMEESKMNLTYVSQYKTLLSNVANRKGSIGEYEISSELNHKVISLSVSLRLIYPIEADIYSILWNTEMLHKKESQDFSNEKNKILAHCLELAKFCKDKYSIEFYKKKIS